MEIPIYDRKWFNEAIAGGMLIKHQPTENINLNRTSDSNAGHIMISLPINKDVSSNCNDIMHLDGIDLSRNAIFDEVPLFDVVDNLQIDSAFFYFNNELQNFNSNDKEYQGFLGHNIFNNTIFAFIQEVYLNEREDSIGTYDFLKGVKFLEEKIEDFLNDTSIDEEDRVIDPEDMFINWLVSDSAYGGVELDCSPKHYFLKFETWLNIFETTLIIFKRPGDDDDDNDDKEDPKDPIDPVDPEIPDPEEPDDSDPLIVVEGDSVFEGETAVFQVNLLENPNGRFINIRFIDYTAHKGKDYLAVGINQDIKLHFVDGSSQIVKPNSKSEYEFYLFPGLLEFTVSVDTYNDNIVEDVEKYTMQISYTDELGNIIEGIGIGYIYDNDNAYAIIKPKFVVEIPNMGQGAVCYEGEYMEFIVECSENSTPLEFDISFMDGSAKDGINYSSADLVCTENVVYDLANKKLLIPAGVHEFELRVPTIDNEFIENTKQFVVKVASSQASGFILDDDDFIEHPDFYIIGALVDEGEDMLIEIHVISEPNIQIVNFTISDETSQMGIDYLNPEDDDYIHIIYDNGDTGAIKPAINGTFSVTVPANNHTFYLKLSTHNDSIVEDSETFKLIMQQGNKRSTATNTIFDIDEDFIEALPNYEHPDYIEPKLYEANTHDPRNKNSTFETSKMITENGNYISIKLNVSNNSKTQNIEMNLLSGDAQKGTHFLVGNQRPIIHQIIDNNVIDINFATTMFKDYILVINPGITEVLILIPTINMPGEIGAKLFQVEFKNKQEISVIDSYILYGLDKYKDHDTGDGDGEDNGEDNGNNGNGTNPDPDEEQQIPELIHYFQFIQRINIKGT